MDVIAFTPCREPARVLAAPLYERHRLTTNGLNVQHWFYDDNDDPDVSTLLRAWVERHDGRILDRLDLPDSPPHDETAYSHSWSDTAVRRIAAIKDAAIAEFLATDATHLFLVDADLVLHPDTLTTLLQAAAPIVSEVFWTRFIEGRPLDPNVWDFMPGTGYDGPDLYFRLRTPGVYDVGGLGACTLIERRVLEDGIRFEPIPNLRMWGEDRHFCVRAAARGWPLKADTHCPPVHLYREEYFEQLERWRLAGWDREVIYGELDDAWEAAVRRDFTRSTSQRIRGKLARMLTG